MIVAYDISREEIRGKLRRFLARMGLSIINRSVYAGVGGMRLAKKIAEEASRLVEGDDHVFIIVVPEEYYYRAYTVTLEGIQEVAGEGFTVE